MSVTETVLRFACAGDELLGIASRGQTIGPVGVVIVVGGPQYRVGSHRQFVQLARHLAAQGIPAFRFDYRGMGDSSGPMRTFESVGDDLRAAVSAFVAAVPSIQGVVLWGLCDGASAALMYCHDDSRVKGLILVNPWVRDAQVQALTQIKHYYRDRFFSKDLWRKVLLGQFEWSRFVIEARSVLARLVGGRSEHSSPGPVSFQDRMIGGWNAFSGPSLIVLSESDITAREFEEYCRQHLEWHRRATRADVTLVHAVGADHTFSTREHRVWVERASFEWIATQFAQSSAPRTP